MGERSGLIRVKKKATLTISEGNTILRGLAELRLVDQRCQTGLKSTLCGEASATPFCQCLSRDFRYQALSRLFPASEEGPGDEASLKPLSGHSSVLPRPVQQSGSPCLKHKFFSDEATQIIDVVTNSAQTTPTHYTCTFSWGEPLYSFSLHLNVVYNGRIRDL